MNRNQKILAMNADGKSYGEIARDLGISRNAVAGVLYRKSEHHCPRGSAKLSDSELGLVQALLTPREQRTPEQYDLIQASGASA